MPLYETCRKPEPLLKFFYALKGRVSAWTQFTPLAYTLIFRKNSPSGYDLGKSMNFLYYKGLNSDFRWSNRLPAMSFPFFGPARARLLPFYSALKMLRLCLLLIGIPFRPFPFTDHSEGRSRERVDLIWGRGTDHGKHYHTLSSPGKEEIEEE